MDENSNYIGSYADMVTQIAENVEQVYFAGQKSEYDRFWDEFQDNGNRTIYQQAFRYNWTDEIFKPKYDIRTASNGANQMFQSSRLVDLKGCLEKQGVVLDTSNATSLLQMFQSSLVKYIPTIDARKSTNNSYTFSTNAIISIEKLISSDTTHYVSSTFNSNSIESLIIEGTIGVNGFNVSTCKKLSHESLMSIINALKDLSGTDKTATVTLGSTKLAKLTDAEKAIATEKGWTLA